MQSIIAAIIGSLVALAAAASGSGTGQAPAPTPAAVPHLRWEVIERRPHDVSAFTQGLQLDATGRLFESIGQYRHSALRELDPLSGEVRRSTSLPDAYFGEGLTIVGDRLYQLTWREGVAFVWSLETFEPAGEFAYEGEGWGLCLDGDRLIMSDGSAQLTFRDPSTFEPLGTVEVTFEATPLPDLNELECVDGLVYANVLGSDSIVRIDPADGTVTGVIDLGGILEQERARTSVLNGIAYDAASGTWLVTGKRWPELFVVRIDG